MKKPARAELIALAKEDPEAIADLVLMLWDRIEKLEARIAEFERNSRNSSKPSSSDKANFTNGGQNPKASAQNLLASLTAKKGIPVRRSKKWPILITSTSTTLPPGPPVPTVTIPLPKHLLMRIGKHGKFSTSRRANWKSPNTAPDIAALLVAPHKAAISSQP